ncbi:four-helix bundle copper-binding protein [Halomarina ordinaria]|uniref:Four-helix bundle copper-binding protein n=1 Tax=Halomarina ordinaria TaxID=3033939 RepID=A0ABD5UFF1_9EURY|nr:four-helix bundle copper-binding protein [Halomarina sp. PSRA2]
MSLTETISRNDRLSDEQRDCIDNCLSAAETCEWCADACIDEGEGMEECIRLCRDVADLTALHARFMARDSDYSADLAATCADACEACADECEQHDHDHCQVCADVLRDCAETCREMASA